MKKIKLHDKFGVYDTNLNIFLSYNQCMKNVFVILLIFLSGINTAFAIQDIKKITLEQAIKHSLKTNPQVEASRLDFEKSKNDIKSANQLKNPAVGTFQNIGTTAQGNPQQIGADLTVEILKRRNKVNFAKTRAVMQENLYDFQKYNLIAQVKISYFNFLLKKSNLNFIEQQRELLRDIYDDTVRKQQKGLCSKSEVIQAKIALNRSIMYYNIAKSEVISAQNKFNAILNSRDTDYDTFEETLGNNFAQLYTLNPQNNCLTFEKIKQYTLLNRYDLKSARAKIDSAKNNLKVVKSNLIPDLEVSAGYAYKTSGISENSSYRQGAYASASIVNIPLFYQYKPEIKNAQIEIEKAQLSYQDLETDVIRDIRDAFEKYTIAKENLNLYDKELLINSRELLDEAYKELNSNKTDLTSFLVSKKSYIELELGYKQALCEYYVSFAQLLCEMNITFDRLDEIVHQDL